MRTRYVKWKGYRFEVEIRIILHVEIVLYARFEETKYIF